MQCVSLGTKATHIKPHEYKSIQAGMMFCPVCGSGNTYFSCKESCWVCFECLGMFVPEWATGAGPPASLPTKLGQFRLARAQPTKPVKPVKAPEPSDTFAALRARLRGGAR